MYYDNKSTFYVKQYGPAIFTIIVSLVLVLGGLYIYLSSNQNNKSQDTLVAKNNLQEQQNVNQTAINEETNNLQKTEENHNTTVDEEVQPQPTKVKDDVININEVKTTNILTSDLGNLSKLEKSSEATVLGIDDSKNIILNISDKNYKASLIGIDYKKSKDTIKDILNKDLLNKKITIAFDNVKQENDILCIYLYVDGNLYNKDLLKKGLAILKVEKANTSLLNELVNAQKDAKSNNIGIWEK